MIVKSKNYGYFDISEGDTIASVGPEPGELGISVAGPARIFVKNNGWVTIQRPFDRTKGNRKSHSSWERVARFYMTNVPPDWVFIDGTYVSASEQYQQIIKELEN